MNNYNLFETIQNDPVYSNLFDLENTIDPNLYGPLLPMYENGYMDLYTDNLNIENWESYMDGITAILDDGIETEYVQSLYANVIFHNGESCKLYIMDLFFNIMHWQLMLTVRVPIQPYHLFFDENITRYYIKNYIDINFTLKYKFMLKNIDMNNIIHNTIKKLALIDNYAYYLANTYSINDDIEMMNQDPEIYNALHLDISDIPIEDAKDYAMDIANQYIEKIKNSDHCLSNSFRAKEGTNAKQFKEQYVSIGPKPNGQGSVYPFAINRSFLNGGVNTLPYAFVDSATGIYAQIISKNNVGTSGHFARILGLNNRDTLLHEDPTYICSSRNFQELVVVDEKMLDDLVGRYYRLHPDGIEKKITPKTKSIIGCKIYLRSPMTCNSKLYGDGICYRCYGDLAYTNCDINIGQIASELLSAELTQKQLSAKHLLEAMIRKLVWQQIFFKIFDISYNFIVVPESDEDLSKYKIRIDTDSIEFDSEEGSEQEDIFNENITEFILVTPDGSQHAIYGADDEGDKVKLYLNPDFKSIINEVYNKKNIDNINTMIEISLDKLEGISIFSVDIANDELSKTLNRVKDLINKKDCTGMYNRHEILAEFLKAIRNGGLQVNPVHIEVLLSNQIRDTNNILLEPDWSIKDNQNYTIFTLDRALTDNPSITTTLSYQKIRKVMYTPLNFIKRKPSSMDLIFMKYPQKFIDQK